MSDEPMTYCAECWDTAKRSQYACFCGSCVVCKCDHPTATVLPNGKTYTEAEVNHAAYVLWLAETD